MKRLLFLLIVVLMLCTTPCRLLAQTKQELVVSAAMSLKNAFEELGKAFEVSNPDAVVRFNFGASGDLSRQIEGGAPVDVFASASQKDVDYLEQKSLIDGASRHNFAANSLVLVVPVTSQLSIASFADLKNEAVKKIAIGSPASVPAGRYAEDVLKHYHVLPLIKDRLVFGENVRQVLDYVARAEVDAGIVYSTDALTRSKDVKVAVTAPEFSHSPILYPIAAIKTSEHSQAATAFIVFVVSEQGKSIMTKHGFK